jgi:hypothetical protein
MAWEKGDRSRMKYPTFYLWLEFQETELFRKVGEGRQQGVEMRRKLS